MRDTIISDADIERVCREWCRLVGIDPDEKNYDDNMNLRTWGRPRWEDGIVYVCRHAELAAAFKACAL